MNKVGGDVYVVPLALGLGLDHNVYLSNFGVNESYLGHEHIAALVRYVVPILALGGSASILGVASRSGSFLHNLRLSQRRAQAVSMYIQTKGIASAQLRIVLGSGEVAPALLNVKDGKEGSIYRAVWISVTEKKNPPPPPPPPPDLRRYSCTDRTHDRNYYDKINNGKQWLFKGASGDNRALHRLIKHAEQNFKDEAYRYDQPNEARIQFYRSYIFNLWFTQGFCGLQRSENPEYAMRQIISYNTSEGLKKKGLLRDLMSHYFDK